MPTILGIESTAHTFGIGIVQNGKILSNVKDSFTTEKGGIIPVAAAEHHKKVAEIVLENAISEAKINLNEIDAIAFSQAPGLAPCLKQGLEFAKKIAKQLDVPLVPVNHCIAHLEIGKITGARDPVMLYASGANTQIIAYASGKYRIFGETLDLGVGNFIDTFARYAGLGFPGGPKIAELAEKSENYIELPYSIKGMDVSFTGMQNKLRQLINNMNLKENKDNSNKAEHNKLILNYNDKKTYLNISKNKINDYSLADLSFSMQETIFAMLVEASERALAHTGKKELLLGGGVACNSRLQEMCRIMCEERGAKFFCPENSLLVDNGAMIAYLGEVMFRKGIFRKDIDKVDFDARQRTDDVKVRWR